MTATEQQTAPACWKTIGVVGDRSCPRLAEAGHCRNCPEYARAGRRLFDRAIPPGLREAWAQALAGAKESDIPGAVSVVAFRIGEEFLALKTGVFVKALEPRTVHRVPFRTHRIFLGIVNIDGALLPCLSVAEILGVSAPGPRVTPADSRRYRRLMVVGRDGARCAFPVDDVLGVSRVPPNRFVNPPPTVSRSAAALTAKVFPLGDWSVGLLDDVKLFEAFKESLAH